MLRRSPGDADAHTDELFDGVVRTVTAQADIRDQNRRRARQFNRKSCTLFFKKFKDNLFRLFYLNNAKIEL